MITTTVEYVDVEENPFDLGYPATGFQGAFAELPEPFLNALVELEKQRDSATCARCDDPIGFVLRDDGVAERLEWTPCGLAREVDHPDHVVALCELCTPFVPKPDVTQAGA